MQIKSANVLITGGASGIGKIMGRMALEKGAKALIIWDVNQEALEATAAEFASRGRVYIYKVDITNSDLVAQTYQQIKQEVGAIDILINCAGIVRGNKTFDQQTVQDIRLTFEVNTIAPMVIAQQILPDMIARNRGHICNIASAGGMLSNPKMSVYGASKAALKIFIESVNVELEKCGTSNRILNVSPGSIKGTSFNHGTTDLSQTTPLASEIIEHLEAKDDLFIPQYEEIFKHVLARYQQDFRAEGRHSYEYKLNSGRL